MRALVVISELPPLITGISRVPENMLRYYPRLGIQVDFFAYRDVRLLRYYEVRLTDTLLRLPTLRRRAQGYDIVHIHGPAPTFADVALLGLALGRRQPWPRILFTFHFPIALPGFMVPSRLYNALLYRMARLADHVTVTSPSYAHLLARYVPSQRLSVVPAGVDFARFHTVQPKPSAPPLRVLFVGQMRATKGLQVLLRAFQGLEGAHLDVVGGGQAEPHYRQLARDLGLKQVTFHGRVPNQVLTRLYAQAHVFVLPSLTEGEAFGIVQLEAMAAGCAVIVSDLPGVRDVAGDVGLTFPPGDHRALRRLIERLRDDPALRESIARRAPQHARRFDWSVAMQEYARIYRALQAGDPVRDPHTPFAFPSPEVAP